MQDDNEDDNEDDNDDETVTDVDKQTESFIELRKKSGCKRKCEESPRETEEILRC